MIFLAVMHMMQELFRIIPQEASRTDVDMLGWVMGFVTLGFGFTGYLLPYTIVGVLATNVGLGLLNPLPPMLQVLIKDVLGASNGLNTTELLRLYEVHIILLPALLLLLLFGKMYMFETHGTAAPDKPLTEKQKTVIPFFPDATAYLLELAALFSAALLLIAAAFPYSLPPQYSLATALSPSTAPPQPDWYFLWMYQILKIQAFEGPGVTIALTIITLIFVGLFVLPFIDRGGERRMANRPKFVILGAIFVAELIVLTYWGKVTPGQTISDESAAVVLGGTALLVAVLFVGIYRVMFARLKGKLSAGMQTTTLQRAQIWTGAFFTVLLVGGALAMAASISSVLQLLTQGMTGTGLLELAGSVGGVGLVLLGTTYLVYRLDLANGTIKTRVPAFEVGWTNEE